MTDGIDLSGRTLGGYELKARIGQGGMADVYLASKHFESEYQQELERQFAVKILFGTTADSTRRFETEMAILLRLNHTNIIRVYDYAVVDGSVYGLAEPFRYFVMDYLDGGTLYERVRHRRLTVREAVDVLRVVANALDFAHSEGIIHRDIKPSNVLFDRAGNPVLADFGISKLGATSAHGAARDMTSEGFMLGTPPYVAPEAFRGVPLDRRADLYSFGVMTYYVLGGQLPFDAETTESLLAKILFGQPPVLAGVNPAIPARASDAVKRMIAKAPEDRFASAGEFIRALERGLSDAPDLGDAQVPQPDDSAGTSLSVITPMMPLPLRLRRTWRWRWWIAGLALVAVIGLVMLVLAQRSGDDDAPNDAALTATADALAALIASPSAVLPTESTGMPTVAATVPVVPATAVPVADLGASSSAVRLVTNAEYRACLASGKCSAQPAYGNLYDDPALAENPVVGLDWFAAQAYCAWRHGRLPSVDEWPLVVEAVTAGATQAASDTVREWLSDEVWDAHYAQTIPPSRLMPVRVMSAPNRLMIKRADEVGADVGFRCVGG